MLFCVTSAHAESILYRCVQPNGKVTYSDAQCNERGNSGKQSEVTILDSPPPVPFKMKPTPTPKAAQIGKHSKLPLYNDGKPPIIRFYYDPTDAPPEHSIGFVEREIERAAEAWQYDCKVKIEYMGLADVGSIPPSKGLMVRWYKEYQNKPHPSHSKTGLGGTGGMLDGIKITPRKKDEALRLESAQRYLQHVILHEMGHVLGLPHNHDDKKSVMSYQIDYITPKVLPKPNEADYRDCNFAMQKWYGVDFKPSRDDVEEHKRERMTDREILERQYGRDPKR